MLVVMWNLNLYQWTFTLWHIKICYCALWIDLLLMNDFTTLGLSFGKYWFHELCRFSKCWYIFIFTVLKSHVWYYNKFHLIASDSLKHNTKLKKYIFQNSNLLESSNFVFGYKFFERIVLLKRRQFYLSSFKKLVFQLPNSELTIACQSVFQVKMIPWKVASSACNSITTQMLCPGDNLLISGGCRSAFWILPILTNGILRSTYESRLFILTLSKGYFLKKWFIIVCFTYTSDCYIYFQIIFQYGLLQGISYIFLGYIVEILVYLFSML